MKCEQRKGSRGCSECEVCEQDQPLTTWVPIEKVVEVVEKSRNREWLWPRNWDCKYLVLRVDMRDGHCIIMDRNQKEISLEELQRQ